MSGNTFGSVFKITTWGESHGEALGVVVDGCPSGLRLSTNDIQSELDKRRVGQSEITSARREADSVNILSGVFRGMTTGMPILLIVYNKDTDSSSYERIKNLFRPGHADYTLFIKYGLRDYRGGGRSSGRETIGRVAAGAIAKKILKRYCIDIIGYTVQVGEIIAKSFKRSEIKRNIIRCPDKNAADKMIRKILEVKRQGDSIGGIVEIRVKGVPPGIGEPVFDKLDADIAKSMMSIGSVKGVEIGNGFKAARLCGSENNDEFESNEGIIKTKTNNAGGILGGISNGEDIIVRIAVKPTASILKRQNTIDIRGNSSVIEVKGRHDPCICPRIIPVAESMMALVIVDHLLRNRVSRLGSL